MEKIVDPFFLYLMSWIKPKKTYHAFAPFKSALCVCGEYAKHRKKATNLGPKPKVFEILVVLSR
jgi:hypothetical protein